MVNYNNCKIYKIEPIEITNTNDIYWSYNKKIFMFKISRT